MEPWAGGALGGRRSVDFTSALYLGIRHSSRTLRPWSQLTTGKPAALGIAPSAQAAAEALAELQGCERAILLPSTLHLFMDLFEALRRQGIRIYADAALYPTALWGVERAAARGAGLQLIPHFDPEAAHIAIEEQRRTQLRPIIVADGFCPGCGRPAPLREYLQCVTPHNGYVVLDDTQALGIWGSKPGLEAPYGSRGGGSLRLHGLRSRHVILGSSLAKGFGVPLAVLSGSTRLIEHFVAQSETLVHASPPSIAALHAAEHALAVNARYGDQIRLRLAELVFRFRKAMQGAGLAAANTVFPMQLFAAGREADAIGLQQLLANAGVHTAVTQPACSRAFKLMFVIRASHSASEIDRSTKILRLALAESLPNHIFAQ